MSLVDCCMRDSYALLLQGRPAQCVEGFFLHWLTLSALHWTGSLGTFLARRQTDDTMRSRLVQEPEEARSYLKATSCITIDFRL